MLGRTPSVVETDWDILYRARRGDVTAWRILSDKYRPRLLALAWSITRSRMAAEDVAQECFTRLITKRPRPSGESLMPWLATVVYRLAVKETRRERKAADCADPELVDSANRPDIEMMERERLQMVMRALSALSEKHRAIVTLRFQGDLSYEEIARLLSLPLGTVKSRLFNAIKNCRKLLDLKD